MIIRPEIAVLRVDAPLYFANARGVADEIAELSRSRPDLRYVVVDCTGITAIDFTGSETIADLERELEEADVELHLAAIRGPVRDVRGRRSGRS